MEQNIFAIVLNYNGFDDTKECVESILKSTGVSINIIIVDNGSSNPSETEKLWKLESEKVKIIETGYNRGYAGGNNIGIKYALEHGAEYICVINNDTIIPPEMFKVCIEEFSDNEKVIVGPTPINYKKDTIQMLGGEVNINRGSIDWEYNGEKYVPSSKIIEGDVISGCCVVFKASQFNEVGYIPEAYFLYWEEDEWLFRAKKNGFKICSTLATYVEHKDSASINKVSGIKEYLLERNRVVFVKRNSSRLNYIKFIIYLFTVTFVKGITRNRYYFKKYRYYSDGIRATWDKEKYPQIIIKE